MGEVDHMKFLNPNTLKDKLVDLLGRIGSFINQTPTKLENSKLYHSPRFRTPLWASSKRSKKTVVPVEKRPIKSSQRPKGRRQSETVIYNHPRKDFHAS